MRRKVPFLGEDQIARADDAAAQAKKASGHLIDDVLSTHKQPSTWDDLVMDYPDPFSAPPKAAPPKVTQPKAAPPQVTRPHAVPAKPVRPRSVPVTAGPVVKKAVIPGSYSDADIGTIDWLPINSGHGLRINICGSLDQNMRTEWRKLLEETAASKVGQFEFNLTDAPTLTLTGLGMLLLFKEQKGSAQGDIKLCHCNKEVWQMLQWTGMDKYFTIQGKPNT
jgi:anti-anti-sigma factor